MEKLLKSLFSLAILGVICFFVYSTFSKPQPSNALINDSVTETIIDAAKKGYKPCDNAKCMNYSKKGWHHMRTQNHPDSDIWLCYGSMSYNQNHLGHLIDSSSGKPLDVGPCPKCDGTGWLEKK